MYALNDYEVPKNSIFWVYMPFKDTTDFINFIEKTEVSQNAILVSMDVTSLYTNISQDGITIVCETYDKYHNNSPPIRSSLFQALGSWERKKSKKGEREKKSPRLSPPSFFSRSFSLVPNYPEPGTG